MTRPMYRCVSLIRPGTSPLRAFLPMAGEDEVLYRTTDRGRNPMPEEASVMPPLEGGLSTATNL